MKRWELSSNATNILCGNMEIQNSGERQLKVENIMQCFHSNLFMCVFFLENFYETSSDNLSWFRKLNATRDYTGEVKFIIKFHTTLDYMLIIFWSIIVCQKILRCCSSLKIYLQSYKNLLKTSKETFLQLSFLYSVLYRVSFKIFIFIDFFPTNIISGKLKWKSSKSKQRVDENQQKNP